MTDLGAQSLQTSLALGTVNIDPALEVAQSSLALVVGQTLSSGTLGRDPHTALLGRGHASEPQRAGAVDLLVDDLTQSVGATGALLLAGVDTLEVDADFVRWTVLVVSAAHTADSVAADLAGGTLLAGDAGDHTHVVAALLAHQAVRGASAGEPAGARLAGAATHTVGVSLAALAVPDAGPLVQRAGDEAGQTLALRLSVPDVALRVWSTGIITNVLTATTHANTFIRAVTIPTGAASLRETPSLVWVAHLTLWTQTTEPGCCGSAVS